MITINKTIVALFLATVCLSAVGGLRTGVVEDRVLVKYRDDAVVAVREAIEQRNGLRPFKEIKRFKVFVYTFDAAQRSVEQVCLSLLKEKDVLHAEPDHLRELAGVSDPDYHWQWYLRNVGQVVNGKTGPAGMDIRWEESRNRYIPQGKIKVAVVDSGVTLLHPDAWESMYYKDIEVADGVDNDGNELIDDFSGYDFYDLDALALDQNGHGTLVAGIIGGTIDNALGGAGITNAVEIIPYRVFDQFGRGGVPKFRVGSSSVSDVLISIAAAVDEGAKIINLSLGGSGYNALEKAAYDELAEYDVLAVIAAGNGGLDGLGDNNDSTPTYPASYSSESIISVAAQQRNGALATFSNYGLISVDIAAPGTDIYGPDVNRETIYSQDFNGAVPGWMVGRGVLDYSGTNWGIDYTNGDGYLRDRLDDYVAYSPWTDTWVRSPYIDLSGSSGTRLTFDMLLLVADDYLALEVSPDGYSWVSYSYYYGSAAQGLGSWQLDLSDLDGLSGYFRFRFTTDYSIQDWGVAIDNIVLSGIDDFDQNNPRYRTDSGTSFAAPIVTGVAAMVWTHCPSLSASQVREAILQAARSMPSLVGLVATGGMVDANAALVYAESLSHTRSAGADFNGDAKPDLIWSNSITGERALWLMDGTSYIAASTLGIFPLEWTVVATGDFNADGKPDLVWSNSVTGERALWLMDGTNLLGVSTLGIFPLEWTVAATGDFNADGKPDLVWSNSVTGERALWLMDGTNLLGVSTLGMFPLEWTVAATGDFNNDGKPDLVWSNRITGERALWLMDGTQFLGSSTLGIFPLEWTVEGVGDYNGDGLADLIWSNSVTGERALWMMNGTQFLSSWSLGIFPLEWTVGN